jgi:hypothetical protein
MDKVLVRKTSITEEMINKKLGYYTCNGREFQSKVQCALYSTQVKHPMHWVFNSQEFESYQWDIDPPGSIDDYYDQRCKELREKYDYLVLSYSGGSDSHNILMSCYRQGIHIDEIVTNWIFAASKKFTINDINVTDGWNQNAEYELNARDKLQWISTHMPRTKISLYDSSRQIIDHFTKAVDEEWVTNAVDALNPAPMQRYNVLNLKEIRSRLDHFKTIGLVIGVDKPRCIISYDSLYLLFNDKIANIIPVANHLVEYTNVGIEYFYWSPDSREMLAKQAHTLLKFLKNNPQYQPAWANVEWNSRVTQEKLLKNIIYTTWDNGFQVTKPVQDWYSEYDYWFAYQFNSAKPGKNWNRGIEFLKQTLDPSLILSTNKGIHGLVAYSSPMYFIGKL